MSAPGLTLPELLDLALSLREKMLAPPSVDSVLVDEADHLGPAGLEDVTDFYDCNEVAGVAREGRCKTGIPIRTRPYSRVGFAHEFRLLGHDELLSVLAEHWASFGLRLGRWHWPRRPRGHRGDRAHHGQATCGSSSGSASKSAASWRSTGSPASPERSWKPPASCS